jgi:hypothetical protein
MLEMYNDLVTVSVSDIPLSSAYIAKSAWSKIFDPASSLPLIEYSKYCSATSSKKKP